MLFQMLCHLRDSKARYAKAPELSPIEELKWYSFWVDFEGVKNNKEGKYWGIENVLTVLNMHCWTMNFTTKTAFNYYFYFYFEWDSRFINRLYKRGALFCWLCVVNRFLCKNEAFISVLISRLKIKSVKYVWSVLTNYNNKKLSTLTFANCD